MKTRTLWTFVLALGFAQPSHGAKGEPAGDPRPVDTLNLNLAANDASSNLSVDDLGFSKETTAGDAEKQKLYGQRTSMLQTHQILALVTLGTMTGAYFTSREGRPARTLHQVFGYSSAALYAATAYFSLAAPEPEGFSEKGWGMKIHRALVFVHLPGMILTPIAGYLANRDLKAGKKPTGLGEYKSAIASTTYFAFAAAALSVSLNF